MKPKSLIELINQLNSLPGISKKAAERIAYYIINEPEVGLWISEAISDANSRILHCNICNNITEEEVCDICKDKTRNKTLIIVESPLDVFKFESVDSLKAHYHVLGGLINISKDIEVKDLFISSIKQRSQKYNEIIIALSPTLEGIVTANYIKSMLSEKKVTQLAQGIPLGAAMEYVDELTLKAAFENRQKGDK